MHMSFELLLTPMMPFEYIYTEKLFSQRLCVLILGTFHRVYEIYIYIRVHHSETNGGSLWISIYHFFCMDLFVSIYLLNN